MPFQMGMKAICILELYYCSYNSFFFRRTTSTPKPGGKHVTITVRETKTERLTPVNQQSSGMHF